MPHWTDRIRKNRYPYSMPQKNHDMMKAAILAAIMTASAIAASAGVFFGLRMMAESPAPVRAVTGHHETSKQPRILTKMQDRIAPDPRFRQNVIIRNIGGNETVVEQIPMHQKRKSAK